MKLNILNTVSKVPEQTERKALGAGLYFVRNDEQTGLYIVTPFSTNIHKIFDTLDYKTKKETDDELSKKANQTQVDDIAASVDVLTITKAEKSIVDAMLNGYTKRPAVDTYNNTSGGKTSLLSTYPNPEKGDDVLVREENTRYNWNGTQWVNLETGNYDDILYAQLNKIFRFSDYSNIDITEFYTIEGESTKGVLVKFLAETRLLYNDANKVSNQITIPADTTWIIPHNYSMYYDRIGNVVTNPTKDDYRSFDRYILLANVYSGVLQESFMLSWKLKLENKQLRENINSSIKIDTTKVSITNNHTIEGESSKGILITIAPTTLYFNRRSKSEQKIIFSEETKFEVKRNWFLYYRISTNEIVNTSIQLADDYILLAESYGGYNVKGLFRGIEDLKFTSEFPTIPVNIKSSIKFSDYENITITENSGNGVKILFGVDTILYYNRYNLYERKINIDAGTSYQIPHNNYLYYNSTTNTLEALTGKPQGTMNYELLAEVHKGIIISGYFYDFILRQNFNSLKDADKYSIPSFYKTHFDEKLAKLRITERNVGKQGDIFVFVTDMHEDVNRLTSANLIRGICSLNQIDKVFCGGDIIDAYGDEENLYKQANSFFSKYNDFIIPYANIYHTRGNHDFMIRESSSSTTGWKLGLNTLYNYFMKRIRGVVQGDIDNSLYYYVDNKDSKVRYIVLNTNEPFNGSTSYSYGYGISPKQTQFFIDAIKLETDWEIVVICHVGFTTVTSTTSSPYRHIKGIIEASNNNTSFLFNETIGEYTFNINEDFSANGAKVICVISGHEHKDVQTYNNGVLHFLTACDALYSNDGITRTNNTITESCLDTITIDKVNSKLRLIRFGAGYDRIFNYNNPLTIGVGTTIQVESEMLGGLTYQSSDETKATINASGSVVGVAIGTVMITAMDTEGNKEFFDVKII